MTDSIAAVVVAVIMSIPGILALINQRKIDKSKEETEEANAAEKIQEAALKMMETYKKEFELLKSKISNLEGRVKELETILKKEMEEKKSIIIGAWTLHEQVKELKGVPKYTPPVPKD